MSVKKFIPDFVTSLNLVCGIIGVIFAFKARFDLAFYCMLLAAVFDFLDGFAARALNAYSDMGKELDSLCDQVSFGVLPSVMLYSLMKSCMFGETWYCWIPLLISVFTALRLARFNVNGSEFEGFQGLAAPACAMICGSLCYYISVDPVSFLSLWAAGPVFIPVFSIVMCWLLVSNIPMFSFKFKKSDSDILKKKRYSFLVIVAGIALICLFCKLNWSLAVLGSMICYVLKNIVYSILDI